MGYIPVAPSWRNDPGLTSTTEYKRKFALFKVECSDNTTVWLEYYYKKYEHWSSGYGNKIFDDDTAYYHTDFIENITEAEYIIRKLAETL
jgi:hypothetical protein